MSGMRFGLIGTHISRSQSPALFRELNPDTESTYELIESASFEEGLDFAVRNRFKAVNVTAPFKDLAFRSSQLHDRISLLTETSNLLVFGNGSIKSYNTDYFGVRDTLNELVEKGSKLQSVLVLGCGGAGKAAILACLDLGLQTFIANRDIHKAEYIAGRYNESARQSGNPARIVVVDFDYISDGQYDLLISALSCTPDNIKNKILSIKNKIIFEAEYRNPVLNEVPESQYVPGTEWLKNQAAPGFRIFFSDF